MTIKIVYYVHSTTVDNEEKRVTGWGESPLSEIGLKQAKANVEQLKEVEFDKIYCSDLKRAVNTAKIMWGETAKIVLDKRLRECNYGEMTGINTKKMKKIMFNYIDNPFPNGESYKDVEKRVKGFLEEVKREGGRKKVAIVAHQAPQLAMEVILKNKKWKQAIKEDWRRKQPKQWKLGWTYYLD